MPLYDFKCDICGTIREFSLNLDKRDEPKVCPFCADNGETNQMRRLFSNIPFRFKISPHQVADATIRER